MLLRTFEGSSSKADNDLRKLIAAKLSSKPKDQKGGSSHNLQAKGSLSIIEKNVIAKFNLNMKQKPVKFKGARNVCHYGIGFTSDIATMVDEKGEDESEYELEQIPEAPPALDIATMVDEKGEDESEYELEQIPEAPPALDGSTSEADNQSSLTEVCKEKKMHSKADEQSSDFGLKRQDSSLENGVVGTSKDEKSALELLKNYDEDSDE